MKLESFFFRELIIWWILSMLVGLLISVVYALTITELFIDGTDERVEITNLTDNSRSGSVVLSWASSTTKQIDHLFLGSGESFIVADKAAMFATFSWQLLTGIWLSLKDTVSLHLQLFDGKDYSLLDELLIDEQGVLAVDNSKSSLHRLFSGEWSEWQWTWVLPSLSRWLHDGYFGHPRRVAATEVTEILHQTGVSESTGCMLSSWRRLLEIFPGWPTMSPYIELQTTTTLPSWWQWQFYWYSTELTGSRQSWAQVLIAQSGLWLHHTRQVIIDDALVVSWRLWSGGLSIEWWYTGQSYYLDYSTTDCWILSGERSAISPWFDRLFTRYLASSIEYVEKEIIIEKTIETIVEHYICTGAIMTGDQPIQTWGGVNMTTGLIVQITDVVYDAPWSDTNNEQVTIHYLSWSWPLDLADWRVTIDGKNKLIWWILHTGESTTITKTFWLPNSKDTCLSLTYQWVVYDEYCYVIQSQPSTSSKQTTTKQSEPKPKEPVPEEDNNDHDNKGDENDYDHEQWNAYTGIAINITDIVYDPDGRDAGNEQITLLLSHPHQVDLAFIDLYVNEKKKKRSWTIRSGSWHTLTWTFGLLNTKPTCIELLYDDILLTSYCYDPTKKILPPESESETEQLPTVQWTILSLFPNPEWADKGKEYVHVLFTGNNSSLSWLSIRVNTTTKPLPGLFWPGEYYLTWSFSLPNSYGCVDLLMKNHLLDSWCYSDPKQWELITADQYLVNNDKSDDENDESDEEETLSLYDRQLLKNIETRTTDGQLCVLYKSFPLDCIKQKAVSQQTSLHDQLAKKYGQLVISHLKDERYMLRAQSELYHIESIYQWLQSKIREWKTTITYWDQLINTYDIVTIRSIYEDLSVIESLEVGIQELMGDKIVSLRSQILSRES